MTRYNTPGTVYEWLHIHDPESPGRVLRVNKTAMLSTYKCIFGQGCKGIKNEATDPDHKLGCCSLGAYVTDLQDYKHIQEQTARLTADDWEMKKLGERIGVFHDMRSPRMKKQDEEGIDRMEDTDDELFAVKTRVVQGACIFANRGKNGKYGCAFHVMAERLNEDFAKVKPHVCTEVPIMVERDVEDDDEVITIDLRSKKDWTESGEFPYWCVDDPDAYNVVTTPAYLNLEPELRLVLGDRDYELMKAALESFITFTMPASPRFLPIVETT